MSLFVLLASLRAKQEHADNEAAETGDIYWEGVSAGLQQAIAAIEEMLK